MKLKIIPKKLIKQYPLHVAVIDNITATCFNYAMIITNKAMAVFLAANLTTVFMYFLMKFLIPFIAVSLAIWVEISQNINLAIFLITLFVIILCVLLIIITRLFIIYAAFSKIRAYSPDLFFCIKNGLKQKAFLLLTVLIVDLSVLYFFIKPVIPLFVFIYFIGGSLTVPYLITFLIWKIEKIISKFRTKNTSNPSSVQ